jgi:hypothetical protein
VGRGEAVGVGRSVRAEKGMKLCDILRICT